MKIALIKGGNNWSGMHNKVRLNQFKAFPVSRYVCCLCGYSEEWIENQKHLDKLHNKFKISDDFDEFV